LCATDGYACFEDGIPVHADAPHITRLTTFFRGAPARAVAGLNDDRPAVAFFQALLGAGVVGALFAGLLLNLLAQVAASACAVDLFLRSGRGPLAAAAFGCLVGASRGVAFYVGAPDAHALCCAWILIGVWLHERLELDREGTPLARAALLGLAVGAALLTYPGDVALLATLWLYGLGRTPLRRLVAVTAVALIVTAAWRVLGRAAGLPFGPQMDQVGEELDALANAVRLIARDAWTPPPDAPAASGFLGAARLHLNAVVSAFGDPYEQRRVADLCSILTEAIVPAFGLPLLALALAGLGFATTLERRLGAALFFSALVAGWPLNTCFHTPRVSLPGALGLALLGAIALAALGRGARRLASAAGVPPRAVSAVEVAVVVLAIGAFALHENSDIWGNTEIPLRLHEGR
jgi:hypothetical protein